MNLRLKTTIDVESKLTELQSALQLSSKASVMRLAIAFSLKMDGDPRIINGKIVHYDLKKQNGSDYNRFTIFGLDDIVYKALMQQHLKMNLDDDVFFPEMTNAHLSRGIIELNAELRLANNKEKFIRGLLKWGDCLWLLYI